MKANKLQIRLKAEPPLDVKMMQSFSAKSIQQFRDQYLNVGGPRADNHWPNIDDKHPDEVSFKELYSAVSYTIVASYRECAFPGPEVSDFVLRDRLLQILQLICRMDALYDQAYDVGVAGGRNGTIRELEEAWRGKWRARHCGNREDTLSKRVLDRYVERFNVVRQQEQLLRKQLKSVHQPWNHLVQEFEGGLRDHAFIDACFDAAIGLETNFETRVFDDHSVRSAPLAPAAGGSPSDPNASYTGGMAAAIDDWGSLVIGVDPAGSRDQTVVAMQRIQGMLTYASQRATPLKNVVQP